MCGRYVLHHSDAELTLRFAVEHSDLTFATSYNAAPTQVRPVIVARESLRQVLECRWGLVPGWAKDPAIGNRMINARAETVREKPSFRTAFARRRCLVPASGFYEWQRLGEQRIPTYVARKDGEPFAMAGLWEQWGGQQGTMLNTFTILTVGPNAVMAPIHDRMPAILSRDDENAWLAGADLAEIHALLRPYPDDLLAARTVSRRVNSPANNDATCIAAVAAT